MFLSKGLCFRLGDGFEALEDEQAEIACLCGLPAGAWAGSLSFYGSKDVAELFYLGVMVVLKVIVYAGSLPFWGEGC